MRQRILSLLLALALLAAIPAVSALAEERTAPADSASAETAPPEDGETESAPESPEETPDRRIPLRRGRTWRTT